MPEETNSNSIPDELLRAAERAGVALESLVARGPFSRLYKGRLGEKAVAVKLYSEQWLASTERIERESRVHQQLQHECVCKGLLSTRFNDGSYALICEWIEGISLREGLSAGPMPLNKVVGIVRSMARALGAVHEAGIVHRDVKPSNIMLPHRGPDAVLVDFGHALIVDETRLTQTGLTLGSAHYMAPEQAMGADLDVRADLYSLGVVLYEMLTGTLPFQGDNAADIMTQHCEEPVVPPSERTRSFVDAEAEDLCMWLLAKNPAERLPNTHVLRLTVDALATLETIEPVCFPVKECQP